MGSAQKVLGSRLKKARLRTGLLQKDVSEMAGFPAHQTISLIERGERDVKAWELALLAKLYKMEITEFLRDDQPSTPSKVVLLWRKEPADVDKGLEASFVQNCRRYQFVEDLCGIKKSVELPACDIPTEEMSYANVRKLANNIRKELNLGSRPAHSLTAVLENQLNFKIWYDYLESGSAATTCADFGPAILMNSSEPPWRRNYNFAHELFHVITWTTRDVRKWKKNIKTWKYIEKLADAFASTLLLPADELQIAFDERIEDNKIEYSAFVDIAREFDVSTSALAWRLVTINRLTETLARNLLKNHEFKDIDKGTMFSRWWDPPKFPERFVRLSFQAYKRGKLSRAKLASFIETSLIDLDDTLAGYDLHEEDDYKAEITIT